jgi:hypothetical protein
MKKIINTIFLVALLSGCVAGPPYLTDNQEKMIPNIQVYKVWYPPDKPYAVIRDVSAADCTGPAGTRLYGQEDLAMDYLKRKAVALGADAVIDVECRSAPFINNCWAARLCSGKAIIWK